MSICLSCPDRVGCLLAGSPAVGDCQGQQRGTRTPAAPDRADLAPTAVVSSPAPASPALPHDGAQPSLADRAATRCAVVGVIGLVAAYALGAVQWAWPTSAGGVGGTWWTLEVARWAALGVAYLWPGWVAWQAAAATLAKRELDVDVLMLVAAIVAAVVGQPAEGALLLCLFAGGRAMEAYSQRRASSALDGLRQLLPEHAIRLDRGTEQTILVTEVRRGDQLLVRAGGRIPVDAVVLAGRSSVDSSALTGESLPIDVGPGDMVRAGTLNQAGLLTIRCDAPATESAMSKVIDLVARAAENRPKTQRLLDRFGPAIAWSVMVTAGLFWLVGGWWLGWDVALYRALGLMIVMSPCALMVSTPAAYAAALATASRLGVLVKGGEHLEALASCRAALLDKTGTLTTGRLSLAAVHSFDEDGVAVELVAEQRDAAVQMAATVARASAHPLSEAIRRAALRGEPAALRDEPAALRGEPAAFRGEPAAFRATPAGLAAEDKNVIVEPGSASAALSAQATETAGQGVALTTATGEHRRLGRLSFVLDALPSRLQVVEQGQEVPGPEHLDPENLGQKGDGRESRGSHVWLSVISRPDAGEQPSARLFRFTLADEPRASAAAVVQGLRRRGIRRVEIATGDRAEAAERVATLVGVDAVHASMLPGDKLHRLESLETEIGPVLMVGDGVNDSAALTRATCGVAIGPRLSASDQSEAGSDIALQSAPIVLLDGRLDALPALLALAQRTRRIVAQNLTLSIGVIVVMAALTITGSAPLAAAVLGHEGSTVLVTLNALRLLAKPQG